MTSQYAQAQMDQAGTFRAWPLSWNIQAPKNPAESQSHAVVIQFAISDRWDPDGNGGGTWTEMPPGWFTYGRAWIVKRDGTVNEAAVKNLRDAKLWNGDFDQFQVEPPNVFVIVEVDAEEYNGKVQHRANRIHPDADVPPEKKTGLKPADPDLLASLRATYGPQVRATIGGQVPAGRPPAPGQAPRAPAAGPRPTTAANGPIERAQAAQQVKKDAAPPARVPPGGQAGPLPQTRLAPPPPASTTDAPAANEDDVPDWVKE